MNTTEHISTGGSIDGDRPKLYSIPAMDLATLLGSWLAGAVLLSRNYSRMGKPVASINVIIAGIVGTVVLGFAVFGFVVGEGMERSLQFMFQGVQVLVVHFVASHLQGDVLSQHKASGGEFYSKWRAAGVSLLVVPAALAILFAVAVTFPGLPALQPEDAMIWTVQMAHHEDWESEDRGEIDWPDFAAEFEGFPWLEQLVESNRLQRVNPAMSVGNPAANRFLTATIIGPTDDYRFYCFYGHLDSDDGTRVVSMEQRRAFLLFERFFKKEFSELQALFDQEGISYEVFFNMQQQGGK